MLWGLELGGREAPPPLAAYTNAPNVITVGSLSKVFWAGLRVGWLRANADVIRRAARARVAYDLGGSVPSQLLARPALLAADQILAARRAQLAERQQVLTTLLAELLPDWSYVSPQGGPYLWARLPFGDAFELGQLAARHGVLITPGHTLSASGSYTNYVRLPFLEEPHVLDAGIRRLSAAWTGYNALAKRRTPRPRLAAADRRTGRVETMRNRPVRSSLRPSSIHARSGTG